MDKIKITIESKEHGKEELIADGIVFTLLRSDEQNQKGLVTSYRGPIHDAAIFGNVLAVTRNFIMNLFGIKTEEEEESFDSKVKQTSKFIQSENAKQASK